MRASHRSLIIDRDEQEVSLAFRDSSFGCRLFDRTLVQGEEFKLSVLRAICKTFWRCSFWVAVGCKGSSLYTLWRLMLRNERRFSEVCLPFALACNRHWLSQKLQISQSPSALSVPTRVDTNAQYAPQTGATPTIGG